VRWPWAWALPTSLQRSRASTLRISTSPWFRTTTVDAGRTSYHLPHGSLIIYVKFIDDTLTEFLLLSFKEK
jgi:hypothetical protein